MKPGIPTLPLNASAAALAAAVFEYLPPILLGGAAADSTLVEELEGEPEETDRTSESSSFFFLPISRSTLSKAYAIRYLFPACQPTAGQPCFPFQCPDLRQEARSPPGLQEFQVEGFRDQDRHPGRADL